MVGSKKSQNLTFPVTLFYVSRARCYLGGKWLCGLFLFLDENIGVFVVDLALGAIIRIQNLDHIIYKSTSRK
jgi:lipid-A-disaccharide synthase-like uncharacterized protein